MLQVQPLKKKKVIFAQVSIEGYKLETYYQLVLWQAQKYLNSIRIFFNPRCVQPEL